jgi:hypothetical protein
MPEANNQLISRRVSSKLRVLRQGVRQLSAIDVAEPTGNDGSMSRKSLQQAQRILLEHRVEKNLSIVQDRQIAWKFGNRFLQQLRQLKDPLPLGQIQEPSRDLHSNFEDRNLFGFSQRAKNRRLAAAGRPDKEDQSVVDVGDSREPLSNLIHCILRPHCLFVRLAGGAAPDPRHQFLPS